MLRSQVTGRIALTSAALLVPCFWTTRIQAGDLSSHLYNAWLAQLIDQGKAPGLSIVSQSTNVLFDLALSALMSAFGAAAAERIAVSICVLVFFWGAFYLATVVNRREPWALAPCLAMLAYGWTFHTGLFNFYLSSGICLWALALLWQDSTARRICGGIALLALAYVAHSLAVLWALGAIVYAAVFLKAPERLRIPLFLVALAAVAGLRLLLTSRYNTFWSPHQTLELAAIDQVWVFGLKYLIISIGLGMFWSFVFLRYSHPLSLSELASGLPYQICALTCAGVLLIPTRIELPQYNAALSFVTERMTLVSGALICVLLGAVKPERWQTWSFVTLATIYFSFLYVDTRDLSALEGKLDAAIARVPAGSRVFSSFASQDSRVPLWSHAVDRACIGRCVSYANYEPYTGQFRIRARANSSAAVATAQDYKGLARGGYVVKDRDLPVFQVVTCGREMCLTSLKAGDVTKSQDVTLFRPLW
jgi:hypothetical protein